MHIVTVEFFRIIGDLPNTYAFTKALAEAAIRKEAQDLPILVFRPTVGTFSTKVAERSIVYRVIRRVLGKYVPLEIVL